MKKFVSRECLLLFMACIIMVTAINIKGATFDDINQSSIFVKQNTNYTCTLASAVMLVRRAALATGNTNWSSITEGSMRSSAWKEGSGLWYSFSYAGISVGHANLPGGNSNTEKLKSLLSSHPEGIIIYDRNRPHAILITDYTNGTFYCADPANNIAKGRIPVSSASITVYNSDEYWYVTSPKINLQDPKPTNPKLTVSKSTTYLGKPIQITPSATGATDYSISIYCNGSKVFSNYSGFTGSISYTPTMPGLHNIVVSCRNKAGYVDVTGKFYVVNSNKIKFELNGGTIDGSSISRKINKFNAYGSADEFDLFNIEGTTVTTNGYWTVITVNSSGQVIATVPYGSTVSSIVPKDGFVFRGHSSVGHQFITMNLPINSYASYNPETATIFAYKNEDYSRYLYENRTYTIGGTYGELPVPTRSGYIFAGWYTNSIGGDFVNYASKVSTTTLYAHWIKSSDVISNYTENYKGHNYVRYDFSVSWEDAKKICEDKGGHLVVISDAAENDFVKKFVEKGKKSFYAIGATDKEVEGQWKWVNGDSFSYQNFDTQLLTEGHNETEDYAYMIAIDNPPNKQSGEWIDNHSAEIQNGYYDWTNSGFICEFDKCLTHTVVIDNGYVATCTKAGLTDGSHCSVCGLVLKKQSSIPPLGHQWNAGIVTKQATCSEEGEKSYSCTRCDSVRTETIALKNHQPGTEKKENEKEATCTEEGSYDRVIRCSKCGAEISRKTVVIKATGHQWDEGRVVKWPTSDEEGEKVYTCTVCGEEKTETIPPTEDEDEGNDDEDDEDELPHSFVKMQLRAKKITKTSITLSWKKVRYANSYTVYGCRAGEEPEELVSYDYGNKVTWTHKKLQKGCYYEYYVEAHDEHGTLLESSNVVYIATSGGKVGNPGSIKLTNVKKGKITLKKNGSFTIKAKMNPSNKKLKVKKYEDILFESSNESVAEVDMWTGEMTAMKKGQCYVWAYCQNGLSKKIKVTVK